MCISAPDLVYRTQSRWFPFHGNLRHSHVLFIGLFKLLFLVFNVVPYVALLIIG
jgi:hypothetical protein